MTTIRFITYNVLAGPLAGAHGIQPKEEPLRRHQVLDLICKMLFDSRYTTILALQEVEMSLYNDLCSLLLSSGYAVIPCLMPHPKLHIYIGTAFILPASDEITLLGYTATNIAEHMASYMDHSDDCYVWHEVFSKMNRHPRFILSMRLWVRRKLYTLHTTHLPVFASLPEHQLLVTKAVLDAAFDAFPSRPEDNGILLGDLNITPSEPGGALLRRSFTPKFSCCEGGRCNPWHASTCFSMSYYQDHRNTTRARHGRFLPDGSFVERHPYYGAIDHIVTLSGEMNIKCRVMDISRSLMPNLGLGIPSDHSPVIAEVLAGRYYSSE